MNSNQASHNYAQPAAKSSRQVRPRSGGSSIRSVEKRMLDGGTLPLCLCLMADSLACSRSRFHSHPISFPPSFHDATRLTERCFFSFFCPVAIAERDVFW
jgi:hypothetical protein